LVVACTAQESRRGVRHKVCCWQVHATTTQDKGAAFSTAAEPIVRPMYQIPLPNAHMRAPCCTNSKTTQQQQVCNMAALLCKGDQHQPPTQFPRHACTHWSTKDTNMPGTRHTGTKTRAHTHTRKQATATGLHHGSWSCAKGTNINPSHNSPLPMCTHWPIKDTTCLGSTI
jgi:hypothetical protein